MLKIFATGALLFVAGMSFAQDAPFGYRMDQLELDQLPVVDVGTFDREALLAEAAEMDKRGGMSLYGKIIDLSLNPTNTGTWTVLENGDRIWQFRFRSEGALAVSVFFDNYYMPEGSSLYIYSADRLWYEGPYGAEENNEHGRFRTAEVFGDEAILEYYEPASVYETAQLGMRGFGHFFRFIQDFRDDRGGGSGDCEVDVNCPEGSDWVDQRQSVVRLSIPAGNGVGLCTGSLVNNTSYDCRNFILTAYHCTIDSDDNDLLDLAVRFNYQRPNCGSGNAPSTQQRVGTFHLADSNDGGGATGSDFALLELEDEIPSNYNPYYAGWDATGATPTAGSNGIKGVCVHHPSGDVKKISTSDDVASGTWGAPNHHWRVEWMATETDWGVTEGGSSGSPLYNKDKRIIGTLTGGGSFCDAPTADDYYGKMDRHWDGNPNPSNEDLVDWLDEAGTGLESIAGSYVGPSLSTPCAPAVGIDENSLTFNDISIYPALADDQLTISTTLYRNVREVRVFNAAGALVKTTALRGELTQLSVSDLADGLYYISFIDINGGFVTQRFSVVH